MERRPQLAGARRASALWPMAIIVVAGSVGVIGVAAIGRAAYQDYLSARPLPRAPSDVEAYVRAVDPQQPLMLQACATLIATRPHAAGAVELCKAEQERGWPSSIAILTAENIQEQ